MSQQKDIFDILYKEVSPKIKAYREKWDRASRGEIMLDFPLHLNVELKIGCNLKCPVCLCSLPFKEWPYKINTNNITVSINIDKIIGK